MYSFQGTIRAQVLRAVTPESLQKHGGRMNGFVRSGTCINITFVRKSKRGKKLLKKIASYRTIWMLSDGKYGDALVQLLIKMLQLRGLAKDSQRLLFVRGQSMGQTDAKGNDTEEAWTAWQQSAAWIDAITLQRVWDSIELWKEKLNAFLRFDEEGGRMRFQSKTAQARRSGEYTVLLCVVVSPVTGSISNCCFYFCFSTSFFRYCWTNAMVGHGR